MLAIWIVAVGSKLRNSPQRKPRSIFLLNINYLCRNTTLLISPPYPHQNECQGKFMMFCRCQEIFWMLVLLKCILRLIIPRSTKTASMNTVTLSYQRKWPRTYQRVALWLKWNGEVLVSNRVEVGNTMLCIVQSHTFFFSADLLAL